MKQKKRFRWHNGNGEILGFAISIMLLFLVMVSVIVFTTYTTRGQQLTVATYCAGRAAALAQYPDLAEERAKSVIKNMYDDRLSISMRIETTEKWTKGNLFTIELNQKFANIFPFQDRVQTCRLTMMIEGSPPRE